MEFRSTDHPAPGEILMQWAAQGPSFDDNDFVLRWRTRAVSRASDESVEPVLLRPAAQWLLAAFYLVLLPLGWWQVDGFEEPAAAEQRLPLLQLDINRAPVEELALLRGLGPQLAARIVEHRSAHGPYQSVEQLMAVPGIGTGRLAGFRDHLTVGHVEPPDVRMRSENALETNDGRDEAEPTDIRR